jgi:hypothetical protein
MSRMTLYRLSRLDDLDGRLAISMRAPYLGSPLSYARCLLAACATRITPKPTPATARVIASGSTQPGLYGSVDVYAGVTL